MNKKPLTIAEQGSFFVGGTVIQADGTYSTENPMSHAGQTFHGDHAYVSYQIPVNARRLPLVFLHGAIRQNLGIHTRWARGLRHVISAARF